MLQLARESPEVGGKRLVSSSIYWLLGGVRSSKRGRSALLSRGLQTDVSYRGGMGGGSSSSSSSSSSRRRYFRLSPTTFTIRGLNLETEVEGLK